MKLKSKEEYTLILNSLGLDTNSRGDVKSSCPVHGGDNPQGFSFSIRHESWKCWTNQCHKEYGGDIVGLVKGIKQINYYEALKYIENILNRPLNTKIENKLSNRHFIRQRTIIDNKNITYPLSILDDMDHNVSYFLDKGISYKTLQEFKAFYCQTPGKTLYGRACIPIIYNNFIVGFTGRKTNAIRNSAIKWLHYPPHNNHKNYLLGFNLSKPYIEKSQVCILVEGPMDILKLWECGIKNVVCVLGNDISNEQRKLLLSCGVKCIILLFDPDVGGQEGLENILQKCRKYFNIIDLSKELYNDPGDMSCEEIQKYIGDKIESIIYKERLYA